MLCKRLNPTLKKCKCLSPWKLLYKFIIKCLSPHSNKSDLATQFHNYIKLIQECVTQSLICAETPNCVKMRICVYIYANLCLPLESFQHNACIINHFVYPKTEFTYIYIHNRKSVIAILAHNTHISFWRMHLSCFPCNWKTLHAYQIF